MEEEDAEALGHLDRILEQHTAEAAEMEREQRGTWRGLGEEPGREEW